MCLSKQPKPRCHRNQKLFLDASLSCAKKAPPLGEAGATVAKLTALAWFFVLILEQT